MVILKILQGGLLTALQAVAGIVDRRHTMPILANVLIRKYGATVEFITSDLEIQVRTMVNLDLDAEADDFSLTVGARKLIDILRSMPSEQTVLLSSTAQNRVTLQGGKSRFTLQTLPSEDFPLVKESSDYGPLFYIPKNILKDLINKVHFSMAFNDIRYYLNGILFVADGESLSLVATDGHRLALAQANIGIEMPRQEVILPRKTVLELQRLLKDTEASNEGDDSPEIDIYFSCNQVKFIFSGVEFVSKLVEGRFPDYNRVIPKDYSRSILILRTQLLASLQRTAILTSEKFKGVRINVEPGMLRISSSNAEQEEAVEEMEIDYTGDEIEIGFNVTYLIDGLTNMNVEMIKVEFKDTDSSAIVTSSELSGFKYVVMPMRI